MLKKCVAALFIFIMSFIPLQATDHLSPSGKTAMAEIEQAYQKGDYDTFLSDLDQQFKRAGKAGALRGIFESAKKALKSKSESVEKIIETNQVKIQELEKSRNDQLKNAIAQSPDSEIAHKVDAILSGSPSDEDQKVLKEFDSLKAKSLENNDSIENKMTAYEIEYYIKSLLLDIGAHKSKNPSSDIENKKIALALEKFSRMEKTATDAVNPVWIEKVQKAKKIFLQKKGYQLDVDSLNNLAAGATVPENSIEEKVKGIMIDYHQQLSLVSKQNQAEIAQK